jgi:hypothetical protein
MTGIESLSDILAKEALTDIAENFFGARRDMDSQLERFDLLLAEVRARGEAADRAGCLLNFLLLQGWAVDPFYQAIGVDPGEFKLQSRCALDRPPDIPFALTRRGAYSKMVLAAYGEFQRAVDVFLNGENVQDARTGRMRLTPHFQQLLELAVAINARIHDLNSNMSPVCVLQYVKTFDPALMEKEKIVGLAPAGEGCSIDEKLAFRPVDIAAVEALDRPELPPAEAVKDRIEAFCRELFASRKAEMQALMARLKRG